MKKVIMIFIASNMLLLSFTGCGLEKGSSNNANISTAQTQTAAKTSSTVKDNSNVSTNPTENKDTNKNSTTQSIAAQKVVLYFPDKEGTSVFKEVREIKSNVAANGTVSKLSVNDIAKACIEELVKGTSKKDLATIIPANTEVRSVAFDKGILTVDLSKEFEQDHIGGSTGVLMTMSQLILTLTELEGVSQVSFKVDGKTLSEFKGHIEFDRPFKRSEYEQFIAK